MQVRGEGFCERHIYAKCLLVLKQMARHIHAYHGRYTYYIRCVVSNLLQCSF